MRETKQDRSPTYLSTLRPENVVLYICHRTINQRSAMIVCLSNIRFRCLRWQYALQNIAFVFLYHCASDGPQIPCAILWVHLLCTHLLHHILLLPWTQSKHSGCLEDIWSHVAPISVWVYRSPDIEPHILLSVVFLNTFIVLLQFLTCFASNTHYHFDDDNNLSSQEDNITVHLFKKSYGWTHIMSRLDWINLISWLKDGVP